MTSIPTNKMKAQIDTAVDHLQEAAQQTKRLSRASVDKAVEAQSPQMGELLEEVYTRLDKMQKVEADNPRAIVTLKDFSADRIARLHASVDRVDKNNDGVVDAGEMSNVRGKTAKLSYALAQAAGNGSSSGSSAPSAGGAVRSSGSSSRGSYVVVDNGTPNGALYASSGHAYAVLNAPGVRSRL